MELYFNLTELAKYKKGLFVFKNLKISDNIGNSDSQWEEEITYDAIDLYLDGIKYDGSIETWAGSKISTDDIFEQCLNAYIRNDIKYYESFSDEWEVFSKVNSLKEYKDGLLIKMPVFSMGQFRIYELDLATPKNRYYNHYDFFLLLDSKNSIITDIEGFCFESMCKDICDILKGELKCLYKSKNVDTMIKEYGCKEGFLKEFDSLKTI